MYNYDMLIVFGMTVLSLLAFSIAWTVKLSTAVISHCENTSTDPETEPFRLFPWPK